jgi:hypothetical protein
MQGESLIRKERQLKSQGARVTTSRILLAQFRLCIFFTFDALFDKK